MPGHQVLAVTCPLDCGEGSQVPLEVGGGTFEVPVPPGVQPGQVFHVQVPTGGEKPTVLPSPEPAPQPADAEQVTLPNVPSEP